MLKYKGSNLSLLKISVELDQQINLKQFVSLYKLFWCILKLSLTATITYSINAEFAKVVATLQDIRYGDLPVFTRLTTTLLDQIDCDR